MSSLVVLGALSAGISATAATRPGELAVRHETPGRTLTVSSTRTDSTQTVRITGPGAAAYDLAVDSATQLRIVFPGAMLVGVAGLDAAGGTIDAAEPGTLRLTLDGRRLARVATLPESVEISFILLSTGEAAEYVIGVGDKLRITIHGDEDVAEQDVRVVGDGVIAVPYIGDVPVAGMTQAEAAAELTRRLAAGYLRDPKLSLEVTEYHSQWVQISGQVVKPGRYYLEGRTTLSGILAQAGGLTDDAGTRVTVIRPARDGRSEESFVVRRDSLFGSTETATPVVVLAGDIITVADEEYFFIKGEVKNPGRYRVDPGTTILRALSLAGGLGEFANRKKVELLRQAESETVRLVINIDKIQNRRAEDVPIEPGDIINVRTRFL
ncbi:MAG: SLBB domain-containing protein [Acidobacteriota bacterium]